MNRFAALWQAADVEIADAGAADGARVARSVDVTDLAAVRSALAAGFRFEGIERGAVDGVRDRARFGRLATDKDEPIAPALPPLPERGLSDGAIRLRVVAPRDGAALFEEDADPVTVATGFSGTAPDPAEVDRMAARAGLEWLVGLGALLAIVDQDSDAFAGSVRLRFAGPPQIGGIGYAVHPRFRGRGYAARALRLLVPWAFEQAGFARLELGAKTSNVASQRAALAGGFEPDGIRARRLRTPDGSFVDEVRFALVNPRYR